ncbi:hypothetical protein [uncultured Robinsoniella sp.]|uniref:PD-(D/E)XK nuclease domain-containing protein n=1 Tax=uncultured Robinsoniella sp. TaxID=904190 RepID=UPI00374F03F3
MNNLLKTYIEELESVRNVEQFENFKIKLDEMMLQEKFEDEIIQSARTKGKYFANKFSDVSTRENMIKAKESLMFYLRDILNEMENGSRKDTRNCLERYLKDFYLFLEAFKEVVPDKRATLTADDLQAIKIENEYDLQHLLYAVLKPLYKDTRKEVTEDSGIGAVRSDIKIASLNCIIEAKCTRTTMSLKKLTEEIEADIVHYSAGFIYFYIYDRSKIIKDRQNFETNFNKYFDGKKVTVIILQPVNI